MSDSKCFLHSKFIRYNIVTNVIELKVQDRVTIKLAFFHDNGQMSRQGIEFD